MTNPMAEQVFAALPRFCVDVFGVDESECIFEIDDNFIVWMESLSFYDDIDFSDVIWRWNQEWGLKISHPDFTEFLWAGTPQSQRTPEIWVEHVKPLLSFRRLSQWLANHIEVPELAPINIAGRDCGPAGAFIGIAEIVNRLVPGEGFPPRSNVKDRIRGRQLGQLWSRLNLCADGRLPPLNRPYWNIGRKLIAAAYAVLLIAIGLTGTSYFGWIAVGLVLVISAGITMSCLRNPLPPEIQTFRDLACTMSAIINGSEPMRVNNAGSK